MGKTENEALFDALRKGKFDPVAQALAAGADAKARTKKPFADTSAFHLLASKWSERIAQAIFDAGADVNATNGMGRTPLFEASYRPPLEWLLEHGAAVDAVDKDGCTAAMWLASGGPMRSRAEDLSLIQLFQSRGADLMRKSARGETLLHFAARNSSDGPEEDCEEPEENRPMGALIDFCLKLGIGLDSLDEGGNSALRDALVRNRLANAQYLIARGSAVSSEEQELLDQLIARSKEDDEEEDG